MNRKPPNDKEHLNKQSLRLGTVSSSSDATQTNDNNNKSLSSSSAGEQQQEQQEQQQQHQQQEEILVPTVEVDGEEQIVEDRRPRKKMKDEHRPPIPGVAVVVQPSVLLTSSGPVLAAATTSITTTKGATTAGGTEPEEKDSRSIVMPRQHRGSDSSGTSIVRAAVQEQDDDDHYADEEEPIVVVNSKSRNTTNKRMITTMGQEEDEQEEQTKHRQQQDEEKQEEKVNSSSRPGAAADSPRQSSTSIVSNNAGGDATTTSATHSTSLPPASTSTSMTSNRSISSPRRSSSSSLGMATTNNGNSTRKSTKGHAHHQRQQREEDDASFVAEAQGMGSRSPPAVGATTAGSDVAKTVGGSKGRSNSAIASNDYNYMRNKSSPGQTTMQPPPAPPFPRKEQESYADGTTMTNSATSATTARHHSTPISSSSPPRLANNVTTGASSALAFRPLVQQQQGMAAMVGNPTTSLSRPFHPHHPQQQQHASSYPSVLGRHPHDFQATTTTASTGWTLNTSGNGTAHTMTSFWPAGVGTNNHSRSMVTANVMGNSTGSANTGLESLRGAVQNSSVDNYLIPPVATSFHPQLLQYSQPNTGLIPNPQQSSTTTRLLGHHSGERMPSSFPGGEAQQDPSRNMTTTSTIHSSTNQQNMMFQQQQQLQTFPLPSNESSAFATTRTLLDGQLRQLHAEQLIMSRQRQHEHQQQLDLAYLHNNLRGQQPILHHENQIQPPNQPVMLLENRAPLADGDMFRLPVEHQQLTMLSQHPLHPQLQQRPILVSGRNMTQLANTNSNVHLNASIETSMRMLDDQIRNLQAEQLMLGTILPTSFDNFVGQQLAPAYLDNLRNGIPSHLDHNSIMQATPQTNMDCHAVLGEQLRHMREEQLVHMPSHPRIDFQPNLHHTAAVENAISNVNNNPRNDNQYLYANPLSGFQHDSSRYLPTNIMRNNSAPTNTTDIPTVISFKKGVKDIDASRNMMIDTHSTRTYKSGEGEKQTIVVEEKEYGMKKRARSKAVDAPLNPLHAYNFFFRDERRKILKSLPDSDDDECDGSDMDMKQDGCNDGDIDKDEETQKSYALPSDESIEKELKKIAEERKKIKKRVHKKTHGKIGFNELTKVISERWQNANTEVKLYYKKFASADAKRYAAEMKEYKRITGDSKNS